MSTEPADPLFEVLKKIPIFEGLTLPELQKIFDICRLIQYGPEEPIYKSGAESKDMFILLEGNLAVRTSSGGEVSKINPIGLVGEMGILTDEPRSANVATLKDVMGFYHQKGRTYGPLYQECENMSEDSSQCGSNTIQEAFHRKHSDGTVEENRSQSEQGS